MADFTLKQVLNTRQDERYVRQLEERTSNREATRTDTAQQVDANARARIAQDAQAQRSADIGRSFDAVQRQRDAQLAQDLKQLEQDRVLSDQRQQALAAAQDQLRASQARQDQARADEARAAEQIALQRADANRAPDPVQAQTPAQRADDRFAAAIAAQANSQNLGNDPIRGRIVNLFA